MVTMATTSCANLQLSDRAYISIIHDHIARSEVTEYVVQLMGLTAGDMGLYTRYNGSPYLTLRRSPEHVE